MNPAIQGQISHRLFETAAQGDVKALAVILSTMTSVDIRDERGWTALMLAARNGHQAVVKHLLEKGCSKDFINNSGQTASDIAKFWGYDHIATLIESGNHGLPLTSPTTEYTNKPQTQDDKIFFGKSFLDRAAHRRKDKNWLQECMKSDTSVFVIFNDDLEALVTPHTDYSNSEPKTTFKLLRGTYDQLKTRIETENMTIENVIFLGIGNTGETKTEAAGNDERCRAWFALKIDGLETSEIEGFHPKAQWLNAFPDGLKLDQGDAGVYAQARSVLCWHDRYGFCPTCGKKTTMTEAGYKRECTDKDCRSLNGVHNTCYPRVDPTVIMVVVSTDGKSILLGRGSRFPRGMYSCLAGFLEPGESIEAACRREVLEEAGIKVGRVEYHSCQPWPMPSSLMIGCLAYATSDNIQVDKEELEDARWFSRHDVIHMLNRRHPERFFIPPEQALAHVLIRAWVKMTSNL